MLYGRVMTAMVTPFKGDDVNYKEAGRLAKFLAENGTDSILLCGSTGENPTMSKEEKLNLIAAVKEEVDIPIMVGTGSNNTRESMAFTQEVDRLGVDGFLLVTPYYNKPNQKGIYTHFKEIASVTETPIMLYNIPGRCVKEIEPETIIELSKIPNIRYLTAACGDLDKISQMVAKDPMCAVPPLCEFMAPYLENGTLGYWQPYEKVHEDNFARLKACAGA